MSATQKAVVHEMEEHLRKKETTLAFYKKESAKLSVEIFNINMVIAELKENLEKANDRPHSES